MEWESIFKRQLWELREGWNERVKAVDYVFEHSFFFSDIKENHEFHVLAKELPWCSEEQRQLIYLTSYPLHTFIIIIK